MRKLIQFMAIVVAILTMAVQCNDIFEVRLDQTNVQINIPVDSLRTSVATQTFWWEKTYGATHYRLQIVSPHFDSISKLLADEVLDTNKFQISLNPGIYQWRLRAENSATQTPWEVRDLIIDSTLDLSDQTIVLLTPTQNDTTNQIIQKFSWQPLYNAADYTFELWQPDFNGSLIKNKTLNTESTTDTLVNTGAFAWRVRGNNLLGSTDFTVRTGFVDTVRPQAPILLSPAANAIITTGNNIVFDWSRPADNGSSLRDSLVVATDTNFAQIYQTYTTNATTQTDSVPTGVIYWRVFSRDKAGNPSPASATRKFTVQ